MARSKNSMLKTRPKHDPYEIWVLGDWEWHVLKKYQADDRKYGARWFALVKTPYAPDGEMGDVWVRHVVAAGAVKKLTDGERFVGEEIQALMADGYTKAQATEMMKDKRYNPYGKKVRRNPRSTGYVAAKIRANTARRNGLLDYGTKSDDDLIDIYAGEKHGSASRALSELKKRGWSENELIEMSAKRAQEEYEGTPSWYYDVGRHL